MALVPGTDDVKQAEIDVWACCRANRCRRYHSKLSLRALPNIVTAAGTKRCVGLEGSRRRVAMVRKDQYGLAQLSPAAL